MKIYTKTGDKGTTALFGGGRTSKADLRVHAYGEVDELNAVVGLARVDLQLSPLQHWMKSISGWLFMLGADLATPLDSKAAAHIQRIEPTYTVQLEQWIDQLEQELPPLRSFILPGGSREAALLHLARTVCRRAERAIVALTEREEINTAVLPFINRLSDFFFVAARWVNYRQGVPDEPWQP